MSVKVIQSRQKNSNLVKQNGSWTTVLKDSESLTLTKGDQIVLKNAFIDTQDTNDDRIVINEDTQLDMTYYIYDVLSSEDGIISVPQTTQTRSDGEIYFLYRDKQGSTETYDLVSGINIKFGDPSDKWLGHRTCKFSYEYRDINNNLIKGSKTSVSTPADRTRTTDLGFIAKKGTVKFTGLNDGFDPPKFKFQNFDISDIVLSTEYNLMSFTKSVVLKAGKYSPAHVGEILTQLFTQAGSTTNAELPPEALLKNGKDYNTDYRFFGNTNYSYVYDEDYYIGSSQFDISFDDEKDKFVIDYIHTPLYRGTSSGSGGAGDIVVDFKQATVNGSPTGVDFIANKKGGIMITSLEPTSFWEDQLGIKVSDFDIDIDYTHEATIEGEAAQIKFPLVKNPTDGLNITGGFYALDDYINKNQADPNKIVDLDYSNTSENTFGIDATKKILSGNAINFPYFIIEFNIGDTKLYAESDTRNITAIVSKYFGYNNFTSCGEEGGVVYIHKTNTPLKVNKINIRILDPTFELPENLGDENTVFLQIVSNNENN